MTTKELRIAAKLTIEEFAVDVGASARTVAYWEAQEKDIDDSGILRPFKSAMKKLVKRASA